MREQQIPETNEGIAFEEMGFDFPITPTPEELDKMSLEEAKTAKARASATMKEYFESLEKSKRNAARRLYRRKSDQELKGYIAGLPVPPAFLTQDELEAIPRKDRKENRKKIFNERIEFFSSLPPLQAQRIRAIETQAKFNDRASVVGNALKKYPP